MLILLLACASQSADSSALSDSETEETETTATTPTDTGSDVQEFDVVCLGEKSYQEQVDLGFVPPAPVDVAVWAHYPDWWVGQSNGDTQSWALAGVELSAQGAAQLPCDGSQYSDLGGPDGFSFVPDRYVVYVKPF